jgi:hypothetical protein
VSWLRRHLSNTVCDFDDGHLQDVNARRSSNLVSGCVFVVQRRIVIDRPIC